MKKDELIKLIDHSLEKAKELLLRDGCLIPVAFVCYKNNIDVIALSFTDEEEKGIQISGIGKIAKMKKADAVFIIVESWYVTSETKDLSIVPSKSPMKKECLFVIGESKEEDIAIIQKFERKKGNNNKEEIIFEKIEKIDTDIGDIGYSKFKFGIKKGGNRESR